MHYFKITVVAVAALVCTSSAARNRVFGNDVAKNLFDVNQYGRGALVAQPKARQATAGKATVTVTITTIPAYCETATPMIPLVFPTTTAKNSTITTAIKTVQAVTSKTSADTTSPATAAAGTTSSQSTATTSKVGTSLPSNVASTTPVAAPTGTLPALKTSALPVSNDVDGKLFSGALVAALLALTGNLVFLI
ncbi:MAG: hypothetical protein LQ347_006093 [Umbilicaria vellea]|nr:MAG: hypothetical protein LQ347_006093 [Umbilicaria vellea]